MCFIQENAHKKIDQMFKSVAIFPYHLASWCKLQIYAFGGPSDLSVVVYTGYQARRSSKGQSKIHYIVLAILNIHVTVIT